MKKIATTLLITLALLIVTTLTFSNCAETPNTAHAYDLKDITFDVNEILNLDNGQGQKYFDDTNPIVSFILRIINFALIVVGSIAVIVLIISGFLMMVSQGNQQKLDEAKDVVKFAIIGLLIIFLSYIIVIFVQSLFTGSETQTPTPIESNKSTE